MTKNFKESEITDWPKHHGIKGETLRKLRSFIDGEMSPEVMSNANKLAVEVLQPLRDHLNEKFPEFGGKLGIRVTCWFRPVAWEKFRGRSGKSQHTKGWAVDIQVVGAGDGREEIMRYIMDYLKDHPGGLAAAYRGNGDFSFIHIDIRGRKARWTY